MCNLWLNNSDFIYFTPVYFHRQTDIFSAIKGVKNATQRSFTFQSQFVTQFAFKLEEQFPEPFFVEPFPQFIFPQFLLPVESFFVIRKQHIPEDTAVKDQIPSAFELPLRKYPSDFYLPMQET